MKFKFNEIEVVDKPFKPREDRNLSYQFESKYYLSFSQEQKEIVLRKTVIDIEKIINQAVAKERVGTIPWHVGSTLSATLVYESKQGLEIDTVNIGNSPIEGLEYNEKNQLIGEKKEIGTEHGLDEKKHPAEVARFKPKDIEPTTGFRKTINMSRVLGVTAYKARIPELNAEPSVNFWKPTTEKTKKLVLLVSSDGIDPSKLKDPQDAMKVLYPSTFPMTKFTDSDLNHLSTRGDLGYNYNDDLTVLRLRIEQISEKTGSKKDHSIRCLVTADGNGNPKHLETLLEQDEVTFSVAQIIVNNWHKVLDDNIQLVHDLFSHKKEFELRLIINHLQLVSQFQGNYPNIVADFEKLKNLSEGPLSSELTLLGKEAGTTKKTAISKIKEFFQNKDVEFTLSEIETLFKSKSETAEILQKFGMHAGFFQQLYNDRNIFTTKKVVKNTSPGT